MLITAYMIILGSVNTWTCALPSNVEPLVLLDSRPAVVRPSGVWIPFEL